MDWGSPEFVIAMVALFTIPWIINTWIRAKHGYPLENEWGGQTAKGDDSGTRELRAENARLAERLAHFEDRVVVLEKIVTERGFDLAHQIEALRDQRDVGVPLAARKSERST